MYCVQDTMSNISMATCTVLPTCIPKIFGYTQISLKFVDNTKIVLMHLIFKTTFSSLTLNFHALTNIHGCVTNLNEILLLH